MKSFVLVQSKNPHFGFFLHIQLNLHLTASATTKAGYCYTVHALMQNIRKPAGK